MFEFFFKYPIPVFTKGKYILLGAWPGWVLIALIVVAAGGLGWLVWRALPEATPRVKNWRVAARSRCSDTRTSMTWPYWSIARYR